MKGIKIKSSNGFEFIAGHPRYVKYMTDSTINVDGVCINGVRYVCSYIGRVHIAPGTKIKIHRDTETDCLIFSKGGIKKGELIRAFNK